MCVGMCVCGGGECVCVCGGVSSLINQTLFPGRIASRHQALCKIRPLRANSQRCGMNHYSMALVIKFFMHILKLRLDDAIHRATSYSLNWIVVLCYNIIINIIEAETTYLGMTDSDMTRLNLVDHNKTTWSAANKLSLGCGHRRS